MYQPVIIIGAPRSGTNMLRDVLSQLEGITTWDCDEINYIWRHGNLSYPTDEFTIDMARDDVRRYVGRSFDNIADAPGVTHVLEKTCANTLRVGFVDRLIPDARYISIVRDGIDSAVSAHQRWRADLDVGYILKKARYVPTTDLPYYATRYLSSRIYRLFSSEKRLSSWGPVTQSLLTDLHEHPLHDVCALQWKRCVDLADAAFAEIDADRVLHLRYEDFVADPARWTHDVLGFIGKEVADDDIIAAVSGVKSTSVGKGREALDVQTLHRLENMIEDTQVRHGYAR